MTKEKLLQKIEQAAKDEVTALDLTKKGLSVLPPEIGKLTNLTKLYLGGNQLSALPPEIGKLTNLTKLDLRGNHLSALPPEIGKLTNLAMLDLRGNHLSALPPEIGKLTNLAMLDLRGNHLSALPPEIGKLTNLAMLDLRENHLSALPPEIGKLTNLTKLYLGGNQLPTLPPEIGKLTNLAMLDLRVNQLSALPPEIGKLTNLAMLDLRENQLSALPPEIGKLTNLTKLDLWENHLSALPPEIGKLTNLTKLYLGGNQLSALPPEIGKLTNLAMLYLWGNQLSALPPEIGKLANLIELELGGNPLPIPPEILEKSYETATIINYYLKHQTDRKRPLNEAKMLLVGQGSVGKTSLRRRLVENRFNPHENITEGIDIKQWGVTVNGQDIRLNIWDFGGQEIMHATHQFFLTKRSLYLLVLDARLTEEENRIEYWLKMIQSFGGNSPIIIVGNKIDQQSLDIDQRGLQAKYKNIKAFVETSCRSGDGIEGLKAIIALEIGSLDHIHDQLLNTWFAVKNQLEEMQKDYIPYHEYVGMCRAENISDGISQRTLIRFLHDLGIVLNFQDDPRLEDTNILNPEWVTNGVYRILNSNELFQSRGVLKRQKLNQILDVREYPKNKHLFIMDMMRKFELCFDFEGFTDRKFLVPDLLVKEEPYTGDWHDALAFQYHYKVLPGSIISRFIVRMHPYIHKSTYWRSGVMLEYEGNRALAKADREEKKIFIWVGGTERTRRTFLAIIRSQFDYIHQTISGIEVEEKVPLPNYPKIVVDYKHLLNLEALGEASFIPEGLTEKVDVKQLLDGVEPEQKRRERRENRIREKSPESWSAPQLKPAMPSATPASNKKSPWSSGLFYLLALAVIMGLIAIISQNVSWYVLPIVIIGGLLAISIIGALQLRQDEKLNQANFLKLMIESFKQMPLLRGDQSTKDAFQRNEEKG